MTDEQAAEYRAFIDRINTDPADTTTVLVLADWLRDRDEKPAVEFALRWMIAAGKRPVFRPDVKRSPWGWHSAGNKDPISRRIRKNAPYCELPRWVFLTYLADVPSSVSWSQPWQPILWLADRLQTVREFLKLDPNALPVMPS